MLVMPFLYGRDHFLFYSPTDTEQSRRISLGCKHVDYFDLLYLFKLDLNLFSGFLTLSICRETGLEIKGHKQFSLKKKKIIFLFEKPKTPNDLEVV